MRSVWIVSAIGLLVLNALTLVPAAGDFHPYLSGASLAVALLLVVAILAKRDEKAQADATKLASAESMPILAAGNRADAEVVNFLAILQDKGRLIDFLMDDITAYDDAQVGAAARVIHQGCKAALQEHFKINRIREESEGSAVIVPTGFAADEYRFVGKISGSTPFSGTLVHRGWKA